MNEGTAAVLLAAVRSRLWRLRFATAARRAAWGAAGLLLLAAIGRVGWPGVDSSALLLPALAAWAVVSAAWTGLRRPTDAECALWADRHLAGASAYSTWVEARSAAAESTHPQSMLALQRWLAQRAPQSLQRLHERHDRLGLARPLSAAVACGALALLAQTVVGPDPATQGPVSASAPDPRQGAALGARPGRPITLTPPAVDDLASALRRGARPSGERTAGGGSPGAVSPPSDRTDAPEAPPASAVARGPDARAAARAAPTGASAATATPATQAQGGHTGGSTGRDAGDSRDTRADSGVSRAVAGAGPMPRSGSVPDRAGVPQVIDASLAATFDERQATPRLPAESGPGTVAAATPPPATDVRPLSPSETTYVQAWMKSRARLH